MIRPLQAYINFAAYADTTTALSQLAHDIRYTEDKQAIENALIQKPDTDGLSLETRLSLSSIVEAFFIEEQKTIPRWIYDPEFYSEEILIPNCLSRLYKLMKDPEHIKALKEGVINTAHPICLRHGYAAGYPLDVF